MSLARYPKYKDSGVEWLGEVPADWGVSRLGFESWVRARLGWKGLKAEEYVDDGFVFLATPNIKGTKIDFSNVNYIDKYRYDESPEIKLRVGDVLLAKDGSTLGTVNVVRALPRPATVNSSIAVITPDERIDGVFLYYLFQSAFMVETIQRLKGGMGVPHLFQEDLTKFFLPLPSKIEQCAIAEFLDRETGKIDSSVEEQRRLIELLKEKRQAVISHAVTKGLNPNAPMKSSGIEWIGEVPAHWTVAKLGFRYEIALGKMLDEKKTTGNHLAPYLRNVDVQWGKINTDDLPVMDFDQDDRLRFSLRPGDLLVCEGGEVGRCAIWNSPDGVFYQKALHRLRPLDPERDLSKFFQFHLFNAATQGRFTASGNKATIVHLPAEALRAYAFAFPQVEEQHKIAAFLESELEKHDALINEAEHAIDLLQERRSALISAAVTGKIDVRASVVECVA
jgi:type I restriction enzyme S subunit